MMKRHHTSHCSIVYHGGFTLLELLLSVAVLTLLATITIPIFQSLQNRNSMDEAVQTIVLALRHAQLLSMGGKSEDPWGIFLDSDGGLVTIFRGDSYGENPDDDQEQTFTESITPSGTTKIVFDQLTGFPESPGEITLTGPRGESRIIEVNEKGNIRY